MPYWLAKSRRRLKYLHAVAVCPAPDGGAYSYHLIMHEDQYIPTSRTWQPSIDAAQEDAQTTLKIKPTDWKHHPEPLPFEKQIQEAIQNVADRIEQAQDTMPRMSERCQAAFRQAKERRLTPAMGRRFKRLLPGNWGCETHLLTIKTDGQWQCISANNPDDKLKLFCKLPVDHGSWYYAMGFVRFTCPDSRMHLPACIMELDENKLILAGFFDIQQFRREPQ